MAHKFATAIALAALTFTGIAAAQLPPSHNSGNASTNAQMGAEAQVNQWHRQLPPPGGYPPVVHTRVCAWRSDGQFVPNHPVRVTASVTFGQCAVNQDRPIESPCQCGDHHGDVVEQIL